MSSLYDIEPQPTGKVVLQTTAGEILLELFTKQTPATGRNFLQLCLDGYYDNTIFHRLVPGFVIQGGDPTGTGEGGEAIYDGGLFADEFHSRLKFNRRGLLGMANSGKKNDNGSQFFLTLGKTEELNGTNTMFGRVAGDTIYNLMKMGEAEVADDGSERPLYPTKITGTEVLVNPFEDMQKRERVVQPIVEKKEPKKKLSKKKGGKTLLSFGGDEGDEEDLAPVTKKAKFNPKLFDGEKATESKVVVDEPHKSSTSKKAPEKPLRKRRASSSPHSSAGPTPEPTHTLPTRSTTKRAQSISSSSSTSPEPERSASNGALSRTNAEIASLKASMRRTGNTGPAAPAEKKSALEQMIPATSIRGRKRKPGRNAAADKESLDMLNAFRAKLDGLIPAPSPNRKESDANAAAPPDQTIPDQNGGEDTGEEAALCDLHFIANCQSCRSWEAEQIAQQRDRRAQNSETADVEDDSDPGGDSWMAHTLSFEKDRLGKDLTWKRKNEEELVVIDPRAKEGEIREERRRTKKKDKVKEWGDALKDGRDKDDAEDKRRRPRHPGTGIGA
ncbi:MAG: Peptidyl-prolyl isomerase cwc27 [Chaenotheca gracillima]|nr:MAG: Peptidyl-prolyl isomerase cwc27 [Chaenotheca gracillima]